MLNMRMKPFKATARAWVLSGLACLLLLGPGQAAQAGWKEVNAALQSGKLAAAVPHLLPLAENGDAEAQYMLGYLLSGASGVKHTWRKLSNGTPSPWPRGKRTPVPPGP